MAETRSLTLATYDYVLNLCGHDEYGAQFLGTMLFIDLTFVLGMIFWSYLDLANPEWVRKYRLQDRGRNTEITKERFIKATKLSVLNITIVTWVIHYIHFRLFKIDMTREMPGTGTAILHMLFCIFVEDVTNYYAHRLMHHPRVYKYVHKTHHEYTAPFAMTACYTHPIEYIITLIRLLAGPTIIGAHITVFWGWMVLAQVALYIIHSGYHLPFFLSSEHHDYHHISFNECYGSARILDKIHGTMKTFDASARSRRHHIIFSLTPAKELYPDDKKE